MCRLKTVPQLAEYWVWDYANRVAVAHLEWVQAFLSNHRDLVDSVQRFVRLSNCTRDLLDLVDLVQVALLCELYLPDLLVGNSLCEDLAQRFWNILQSKVFPYQRLGHDHPLVHTANVYLFMTDVHHTSTWNRCSKTSHHRLNVQVNFPESHCLENSLQQILRMLSHKNVRHDQHATEIDKLFWWNFQQRR